MQLLTHSEKISLREEIKAKLDKRLADADIIGRPNTEELRLVVQSILEDIVKEYPEYFIEYLTSASFNVDIITKEEKVTAYSVSVVESLSDAENH